MTQAPIQSELDQTLALLRARLGAGGDSLARALKKTRHRLPRRIRRQAAYLARAEELAAHPRLRLTLDRPALHRAAREVQAHLRAIDLADRRKGWWLGMLGGLAFNLLLFFVLLLLALRHFGHL